MADSTREGLKMMRQMFFVGNEKTNIWSVWNAAGSTNPVQKYWDDKFYNVHDDIILTLNEAISRDSSED